MIGQMSLALQEKMESCHWNLKYGRLAQNQLGTVGVCGDMREQGNLLRLWVMPTQQVLSSGWADLWGVLCFEVWPSWDWWHQESGRAGGDMARLWVDPSTAGVGGHLFSYL